MKPAEPRDVRRHNLRLVLGEVARGPRSRARLAVETGLNKSTVSSLVAELCEHGLLRESGQERSGAVGRPPQNVELDPGGPFVLGLEINVDYLAVWATDLGGAVLHRSFTASDNRDEPETVVARLESLAGEALAEPFAQGRFPVASAVAVPGIVGHDGEVVVAPNLHWEAVPLPGMLSGELGPLAVENEANLGALAELTEGAGRGLANFVYLSAEVGIGAGIVVGGELFRGAHGFGGEIGHLTIDPYGPPCPCGSRGCLERLAGQDALLRLAGWDARVRGPGPRPEWPGAMLAASARAGHPKTLEALSQVGHTLGIAAAAVVNLLNPQALLLGGYFAPVAEWLREPIEAELHRRLLAGDGSGCQVLEARLGGEAAVRGAAASARRRVLADPLGHARPALGVPSLG
ncbi:MAG TPA: ROK family transcriptional regulator [Thermoleophilaceae bacterium]|jgi:predicted NBD/HSP70 family sugar kinase|nr:ROK family transcriptional regulator [Thermoleophilaceae bacterium]